MYLPLLLTIALITKCCFGKEASLVATFIVRDEDVNLKVNLPLWLSIVDYFAFVVDSRTSDNSVQTIERILRSGNKPFVIKPYQFSGFGSARTLSLKTAWEAFGNASHVLIADPDWRPDLATLSKQELTDDVDVFRFTVFDRNGETRRRMDWLLKHRQGLAMRYALHEVLDIGQYTVKEINWKISEIEKPGSWHSSVGHGNSMSIARLNFDLELLLRDLDEYGSDPHTHYYLGTTFHGVSEKLLLDHGIYNESAIDNAIKYLKLRLYSNYTAEFFEERWGCMYVLGGIYATMKKEYPSAVHWLSMCRDYNPNQAECGLALARYYFYNGMIEKSLAEVEKVLVRGHEDRVMLNMLRTKDCSVPQLVIDLFKQKARLGLLTSGDAKFMMLMAHMLDNPLCHTKDFATSEVWSVVAPILAHQSDFSVQKSSSAEFLCEQADVQSYLAAKKYKIHPCSAFQSMFDAQKACMMFASNLPPASDELQLSIGENGFIGAGNIPDILHHVWRADTNRILRHTVANPLKILFAEFFHPKMVENIVGYFHRIQFVNYQITVVTHSSHRISSIQNSLKFCSKLYGAVLNHDRVIFVEKKLSAFLKDTRDKFDYIEYNGGISMSQDYENQLLSLSTVLSRDGVLGITYFAANSHLAAIQSQLASMNHNFLMPFSLETKRQIVLYLETHGMDLLTKDDELLIFLGAEPAFRKYPPSSRSDIIPSVNWTSFSREKVKSLLSAANLIDMAWIPTAYSHPYENLEHVSVQKFRSLGVSESYFVENYLTNFRYTTYAQPIHNKATNCKRPLITKDMILDKAISSSIYVTDRLGSLGNSLTALLESAKLGQSGQLGFAPYALNQKFALDYTASPLIAPSLALLSNNPSIFDLLSAALEFPYKHARSHEGDEKQLTAKMLSDMLDFMERINAITYARNDGPICHWEEISQQTEVPPPGIVKKGNYDIQAERMRELGFDEDFIEDALQFDNDDEEENTAEEAIELDGEESPGKEDANVAESQIKSKLASILKILHEKGDNMPNKNSGKVRTALDTIEKLRATTSVSENIGGEDKTRPIEQHGEKLIRHSELSDAIVLNFKSLGNSHRMYRSSLCFQSLLKAQKDNDCTQTKPVRRRTAAIQSTSYSKVLFDLWVAANVNSIISDRETIRDLNSYRAALENVKTHMESKRMTQPTKAHRLIGADIATDSLLMNHAIYIHEVPSLTNHTLLQWGAIQQMKQVSEQRTLDRNDYVVLDVLLQPSSLQKIEQVLSTSTIWYDSTNGAAFAAHYDDGLANLPIFWSLAKQIALSMTDKNTMQVNKFYVLSLPQNVGVIGPVSLANRNEIVAMVWLNGPLNDNDENNEDGLRIFDSLAADCLFGQGISFYPSVHPEFLSKGGDLAIDVTTRCGGYHSEHINRVANRLVIVRDRMPFYFEGGAAKDHTSPTFVFVVHLGSK